MTGRHFIATSLPLMELQNIAFAKYFMTLTLSSRTEKCNKKKTICFITVSVIPLGGRIGDGAG